MDPSVRSPGGWARASWCSRNRSLASPSAHQRLAVRRRAAVDLEAEPLIQPESPVGILRIHAEHGVAQPDVAEPLERQLRDRPAEPTAAPWPADADVLEPAAPHPQRPVLLG